MAAKRGENCASQYIKVFQFSRLLKKTKHILCLDTSAKGYLVVEDNLICILRVTISILKRIALYISKLYL